MKNQDLKDKLKHIQVEFDLKQKELMKQFCDVKICPIVCMDV